MNICIHIHMYNAWTGTHVHLQYGPTIQSIDCISRREPLGWDLPELLGARLKIAQTPSMIWSLGPKTLTYESLEP